MFPEERRFKIRQFLYQNKSVSVETLSKIFNVSDETIRRDLKVLQNEKIIKKTYGMASLYEEIQTLPISTLQQRRLEEQKEKILIAQESVDLLNNSRSIFLDAGSTTEYIARELRNYRKSTNINIITNGINIAVECNNIEQAETYLLGGYLRKGILSIVGPQATRELKNYSIDIAFMGVTGITAGKGFFSSNIDEVEVKKSVVSIARRVVIVADHTKFNKYGLRSFCNFEDIDYLITSDLIDVSSLRKIEKNYKKKLRIVKMSSSDKSSV